MTDRQDGPWSKFKTRAELEGPWTKYEAVYNNRPYSQFIQDGRLVMPESELDGGRIGVRRKGETGWTGYPNGVSVAQLIRNYGTDFEVETMRGRAADVVRENPLAVIPYGFDQGYAASFGDEVAGTDAPFAGAWDANPVGYSAAYIAGSIPGAPGKVAGWASGAVREGVKRATASLWPRVASTATNVAGSAAGGAAAGGLDYAGFGNAETPMGRVEDFGTGAKWGAALGAPLPFASQAVGHVAERVGRRIPVVRNFFTAKDADNPGMRRLVDHLVDDGVDVEQAHTLAIDWLSRGAGRTPTGQRPPTDGLEAAATRMRQAGQSPPTLLDLAYQNNWTNTLNFLEDMGSKKGPAVARIERERDARMDQRADRSLTRLDELSQTGNAGAANAEGARRVIKDVARDAADDAYGGRVTGTGGIDVEPIKHSAVLTETVNSEAGQKGLRQLTREAAAGDLPPDELSLVRRYVETTTRPDGSEVLTISKDAPAAAWQLFAFATRDALKTARFNPEPGYALSNRAFFARKMRVNNLIKELRKQSPSLKEGDFQWRMDMGALGATDDGAAIINPKSHNEWVRAVGQMSEPELIAAREAAVEQIYTMSAKSRSTLPNRLRRGSNTFDPQLARRLTTLFGDDAERVVLGMLDELDRAPAAARISHETGPDTARRIKKAEEARPGNWRQAIDMVIDAIAGERQLTPAEADEVIKLATAPWTTENRAAKATLLRALNAGKDQLKKNFGTGQLSGLAGANIPRIEHVKPYQ